MSTVTTALSNIVDATRALERCVRGETWHGTVTGYTGHACRCDACKQAKAESWATYANRKGAGG